MTRPPHPGAILKSEYMKNCDLNISALAKYLGVRRATISDIVNEKAGISSDMAKKLSNKFQTKPDFWLGIDLEFKLWKKQNEFAEK